MTTPKGYRPASFRGVKFAVRESDYDTGQRVAKHEFVNRDLPYGEPLGRKTRTFTIDAFVIEDERATRDALIAACEKAGSGELVHPFYGTRPVICEQCQVKEGEERRITRFSLSFFETALAPSPVVKKDAQTGLFSSVDSLVSAANSHFETAFDAAGKPGFVVDDALSNLAQVADLTEKASTSIRDALSNLAQVADLTEKASTSIRSETQSIADTAYKLKTLRADFRDLIATPGALATRLTNAMGLLSGLIPGGDRTEVALAFRGFLSYGSGFTAVPRTTANRERQAENQTALRNLVHEAALGYAAREAAEATFPTLSDAETMRDELAAEIETQMAATPSDEVFSQLQAVKAALLETVPSEDESLPLLGSYDLTSTTASLPLLYELYGELVLEEDLLARNRIRHPGIVVPNQTLQFIRRA